jgi:hypothetical protein
MAGGNNNSTAGLFGQYPEANNWCRRYLGTEVYLYAITGDYFGGGCRKVLRGETGIIADYQTLVGQSRLPKIISYPLSTGPHVIEGEILSYNRSPAVGAKLNGITNLRHPLDLIR